MALELSDRDWDLLETKMENATLKAINKHKEECMVDRREWKKIVIEQKNGNGNVKIPKKFWIAVTALVTALTALVQLGITYLVGHIG